MREIPVRSPKATRKQRKAKSPTKSAENKAAYAAIRRLVAEGEWAEAIAVAEGRGWIGEAYRLLARAMKAGEAKPTKQRKARKQPKAVGGESRDGDGTPIFDEDAVGGGAEAIPLSAEPTLEDVLRSARGSAMSAVCWAKQLGEPQRIDKQVKDLDQKLRGARKARSVAQERGDEVA